MNPAPWRATVLTLFPAMFPGPLGHSLAGRALDNGKWLLETVDIRDFASDKHASVDDTAFGGGPGMVMRADVLAAAIDAACVVDDGEGDDGAGDDHAPRILLTPRGRRLDQRRVRELAMAPGIVVVCGRYEGVDERIVEARNLEEISLGDFVLSGGEVAALALIDACVRSLPGVVGDPASLEDESFERGLLGYPQYTRPAEWEGRAVPEVLLSGHHERIRKWRRDEAEKATRERRPGLWARYQASRDRARTD